MMGTIWAHLKNMIKGLTEDFVYELEIYHVHFRKASCLKELVSAPKECGIIIGKVGARRRAKLIAKSEEMKITVLNKYLEKKE